MRSYVTYVANLVITLSVRHMTLPKQFLVDRATWGKKTDTETIAVNSPQHHRIRWHRPPVHRTRYWNIFRHESAALTTNTEDGCFFFQTLK